MRKNFRSYVPELLFGEQKQEMPTRICREDFVAVDPSDQYRILTGRGLYAQAGNLLPKVWRLPRAEMEWLERALISHRRVLLNGADGAVLIFADVLDATGLLFAVRPYLSVSSLLNGLRHLELGDVAISPTLDEPSHPSWYQENALTQIAELFYYMDRIFDTPARFEIGAWTRTRLIANFVGCKLESVDLPIQEPTISHAERDRLTAFLICALLEMRKMDGDVRASGEDETPHFRCRVELTPFGRLSKHAEEQTGLIPLLGLPAFRNFTLRRENGALVLDALLQDSLQSTALHAGLPDYWCWRIVLNAG